MSEIEVKSVPGIAGSAMPYAYAVKAGPWIFLTGHEAFDFATGSGAAVAGPPGFPLWGAPRYRREGDFILRRMRAILREFGADLPNGVRLDQFYPAPDPVDPYHLARRAEFGDYIPPSTSVVMERCFSAEAAISTSLMAVVPTPGYEIGRVYPKDVSAPTWSGFVPAITCSDFVFVAGQMATGKGGGLDPRAHVPDHTRWAGSEIRRQTEFLILEKLKPALEAAGSALEHSVKAQVYIEKVEDFPDFLEVWTEHYRDIPCALTVVPTKSYATVGGIIEINLLALKAGAARAKTVVEAPVPPMACYGPCVRAGEFLFPSGLMALGPDGHVLGKAVSPAFTGLAHAGQVQAEAVLGYADALCRAAGAKAENIVRAQWFVTDIADFAGIGAAWAQRFGDRPHPFLCVAVPAPLPAPGAALIADFWIYAP
jgi:enamine deaminase RidA (YjgF/YER057c/UK114 family)